MISALMSSVRLLCFGGFPGHFLFGSLSIHCKQEVPVAGVPGPITPLSPGTQPKTVAPKFITPIVNMDIPMRTHSVSKRHADSANMVRILVRTVESRRAAHASWHLQPHWEAPFRGHKLPQVLTTKPTGRSRSQKPVHVGFEGNCCSEGMQSVHPGRGSG